MYRRFFGLAERPFDLTPNPEYLLLTDIHREALAMLQYGVSARKGMVVLTGEAGTGKTTLLRTLQADAPDSSLFVTIANPRLSPDEFVETIAHGFGLPADVERSKPRMLEELRALLLDRARTDCWTALVVDEAHAAAQDLLEEVRLLANLETETTKLLTIVLAGQPELADRLNEPSQWHLKQRVALRCTLRPLTREEVFAFVASRIRTAGGQPNGMFSREAVEACHAFSRGIPRLVCVICDNALIAAYAAEERPVTAARIREVCHDLDLTADTPQIPQLQPGTNGAQADAIVRNFPERAAEEPAAHAPALFGRFSEPRRAWFGRRVVDGKSC